ncbi:hypothetical protein G7047_16870 [Diaphorobacter sp. HDW4A]|uniref:hypothetical protein n=1 Tax=Diaphorobacter sp. HDW4A TaxID=2714924 RepID=UPI00140B68A6|nr:hypothetical protein [Diaphorobacter sp. HDW4A]QIL81396.1 hypothetical protein G7047_16870 [Diaphorobacter sp. HDW4A]
MNTTESPHINVWIAAGVQHAVLSRTMPALRHDLAGSVSVLRMALAVISRKIESSGDQISREVMVPRITPLEAAINDLNAGLRRLRHWDKQLHEVLDARTLLGEILDLSRPFLALRNIEQSPLPSAEEAAWPLQALTPQPLMYLMLASIYHLAEGRGKAPQHIAIHPETDRIRISAERGVSTASASDITHGEDLINTPPIDRRGLQCLADHLQSRIEFESDQSVLVYLG